MPHSGHATPVWALKLAVVTALVGVSGGIAGIAVWLALQLIQFVAFGYGFGGHLEAADAPSGLNRFIALTAAGVLTGFAWWALRRWGRSIVSVTAAVDGKRMPALATLANAGIQILAVGLGASIGKEVAPREVGAWLAQLVTRRAGLTARETKILVACGAAAGLAAVYDVPLGGALFAVEVLLGEISFATALPAFATSAVAAITARLVIPDEVLYHVPAMHLSPSLLVWAVVVGPVLGLAGVGFVKLTNRLQGIAPKGWHLLVVLPVVFAMVGLIAIPFPEILGNGRALGLVAMNTTLDDASFAGLSPIVLLLLLAVLRTVTTSATIGAGAVGGTLTPSIAIGSAIGGGLGGAWLLLWPADGPSLAAFAFVGAAAFLATTMRAPFTALVLVVEFTQQGTDILVPSLLAVSGAVAVGYVLARRRSAQMV
ncbi:chloride channel protein [Curtobacterium flaccumfaciens]|uniref:chloride channel protein n=1 Tax=Curtobacterium flaccumfaciens TaxID=2035 RepID=UPI001BDF381A|nr:chloride channel protein [Curtobacterium flaccumfaciens]MBT1608583.1 chloride channel protein [Curtobacterium flaccumfaciens pv. betae]MBT1658343.1 chloride channel protein [Curtobacterium flaccumfaciens pv. betae]MCS0470256.1 chloride channel protein [Curtobacterium flaccumfaciens pv. betae]MCS0474857.1 chloride channel protein [Curtobacterium flaccumfaciens pv. betae]MCS0479563.1 chloride channel protein [Curtobacterium flaccumfaciens pv. betae]